MKTTSFACDEDLKSAVLDAGDGACDFSRSHHSPDRRARKVCTAEQMSMQQPISGAGAVTGAAADQALGNAAGTGKAPRPLRPCPESWEGRFPATSMAIETAFIGINFA